MCTLCIFVYLGCEDFTQAVLMLWGLHQAACGQGCAAHPQVFPGKTGTKQVRRFVVCSSMGGTFQVTAGFQDLDILKKANQKKGFEV